MAHFQDLFESSLANKRGLTVFVNGQTVAGYATRLDEHTVELRSQQHDRIVILRERIDGVAQ